MHRPRDLGTTARLALVVACGCGSMHAAASLYWALGGSRLLETVGDVADDVGGPLLVVVAAVKAVAAVVPLVLASWWVPRRAARALGWVGAGLLVLWGGVNTVTASALLARVVERPDPFDRTAALGHALLWDPLFLVWSTALVIALRATSRRRLGHRDRPVGSVRSDR